MTAPPIRILSFGSVPPEWGGSVRGGVATFHATLISALAAHPGATVIGLVASRGDAVRAPVATFDPPPGTRLREFLADVVQDLRPHVALLNNFTGAYARLLPEVTPDVRRIGVAHSWHAVTFAADERRSEVERGTQEALDRLDALVLVSRHCEAEGAALGLVYPRRTATILYPLQPAFAAPLDVGGPRAGVTFVGSLMGRKNPARLVEATAHLPRDVEVRFFGAGPEEAALRELAGEHGVAGRVAFHTQQNDADHLDRLRKVLAASEVMCLPSMSESFGLVFIEALACGTPIVGFGPTVREIEDAMGIPIGAAVDSPEPETLAAAIEQLRATRWDPGLLRRVTLETFSVPSVAEQYAELCRAAAQAPR